MTPRKDPDSGPQTSQDRSFLSRLLSGLSDLFLASPTPRFTPSRAELYRELIRLRKDFQKLSEKNADLQFENECLLDEFRHRFQPVLWRDQQALKE